MEAFEMGPRAGKTTIDQSLFFGKCMFCSYDLKCHRPSASIIAMLEQKFFDQYNFAASYILG